MAVYEVSYIKWEFDFEEEDFVAVVVSEDFYTLEKATGLYDLMKDTYNVSQVRLCAVLEQNNKPT